MKLLKQDILAGRLEPRTVLKGATDMSTRSKPQSDHADAFFNWAYDNLAESLANIIKVESDQNTKGKDDNTNTMLDLGPTTMFTEAAYIDPTTRPPRFLPPGRLKELYEFYVQQASSEGYASEAVFKKVYRKHGWRKTLPFRRPQEHSRCTLCAKYSKARAMANSSQEKKKAAEAHAEHIRGVMRDRAIYARLQQMARESTLWQGGPAELAASETSCLSITIDGMDQAPSNETTWETEQNI